MLIVGFIITIQTKKGKRFYIVSKTRERIIVELNFIDVPGVTGKNQSMKLKQITAFLILQSNLST